MKYTQLGRSGLEVSRICLGCMTYGTPKWRPWVLDEVDSRPFYKKALDLGINFFDTANVYGRGAAEEFLGETLSGIERSSYVLATKVFFPMSRKDRGLSAAQIHKQIEASLRRLRTDYVDLYQCHRYDRDTPLEETMQALTDVVREGKARYVGISEWKAPQIQAALDLPGVEGIVSSQPQYSMLYRAPVMARSAPRLLPGRHLVAAMFPHDDLGLWLAGAGVERQRPKGGVAQRSSTSPSAIAAGAPQYCLLHLHEQRIYYTVAASACDSI